MPETKPDLQIFEDGECDACKSFKNRKLIDWDKRKKELIKVAKKFKSKNSLSSSGHSIWSPPA